MKQLEKTGQLLSAQRPSDDEVQAFQELQRNLWLEQRSLGNPWLVTDLITLGSPLVHAELLLANGKEELVERQAEYELPTCPPQPTERRGYSYLGPNYKVENQTRTIRILHHAAHFACTRWTNIYFPGDFVGGPL